MAMDSSMLNLAQVYQTASSSLPAATQHLFTSPAKGILAALFGCYALKKTSGILSRYVLDNWHAAEPWDSRKELVLVTGGCSGIGQRMAEDLSQLGTNVVILDIQEPKTTLPSNVYFYKADITSADSIKIAAEGIRAKHGHPTVLVNNAGTFFNGTVLNEPEDQIWQSFKVNALAHFLTVKEFLPNMVQKNHGHIVTMASMASFITVGEMVDYACTKASALAFHEGISQEIRYWYKATKIRTSIVHPLWVQTPLIHKLTAAGDLFGQPIMDTGMVSGVVVEQILARRSGPIILPAASGAAASLIRSFPAWLQEWLRNSFSRKVKKVRDEFWSLEESSQ